MIIGGLSTLCFGILVVIVTAILKNGTAYDVSALAGQIGLKSSYSIVVDLFFFLSIACIVVGTIVLIIGLVKKSKK